jgi:hypothetical protein
MIVLCSLSCWKESEQGSDDAVRRTTHPLPIPLPEGKGELVKIYQKV